MILPGMIRLFCLFVAKVMNDPGGQSVVPIVLAVRGGLIFVQAAGYPSGVQTLSPS